MFDQEARVRELFGPPEALARHGEPLYTQLQRRLRQALAQGALGRGERLPPERDIARVMAVSRVTVRRAVDDLVDEGLLTQRQGAGTFVADRVEQPLNRVKSFSEIIRERGRQPTSKWLERSVALPSAEEREALGLDGDAEVVRLHRLRLADGEPMGLEVAALPRRFLSDPLQVEGSLYVAMEHMGMRPVRALQRLRAVTIDAARAQLLAMPARAAALYIERVGLLADATPVEFTRSWFPGDAYDFVIEIHHPDGG